ncbi:MAG: glycosyltransferase family 4 protein [bacterium]
MKICMIGQKGIPTIYGGIERHVEELAKELAHKNQQVLVYARSWYTPTNVKKIGSIRIIHTPCLKTKHLDAITHTFTATLHALTQKPDIVHYHGVGPSLMAFIPKLLLRRTKVVVTAHCLDRYHKKWGWFARLVLRIGEWTSAVFSHQTITVSKNLKSYYLNEYKKMTSYIPNGVNFEDKPMNSAIIEDKWNLTPKKYVVMISRLVRHKGAHYLIDAWQFAKTMYPKLFNGYKLVIVGGSNYTDDYVKELKTMARGNSSIIFTGWQSGQTLKELYANATILVHPSENEGLPLTVLQAMSFATPVLVSDINEHKELITDSRFWFQNANVASLSEKLIELFKNEKLTLESGITNQANARQNFDWADIASQTASLYEHLHKKCATECACRV